MNNTLEIKIQDLKNLNKEEYLLVDIREEAAFAHGFIPSEYSSVKASGEAGASAKRQKDNFILRQRNFKL